MQQQGFSEQWQAIAMQCLATLAWSAPASVHSAAKEWAVECITKWDYSSNKVHMHTHIHTHAHTRSHFLILFSSMLYFC